MADAAIVDLDLDVRRKRLAPFDSERPRRVFGSGVPKAFAEKQTGVLMVGSAEATVAGTTRDYNRRIKPRRVPRLIVGRELSDGFMSRIANA
jgi:hypothetical protein